MDQDSASAGVPKVLEYTPSEAGEQASVPEGFSSLAEATLAGCKCVLFGKGNRHWPCPIHASCKRPNLGQRKAAQIGPVIGVLVQNQDGEVAAVTDMGRCTWLNQDVTGPVPEEPLCRMCGGNDVYGDCPSNVRHVEQDQAQ